MINLTLKCLPLLQILMAFPVFAFFFCYQVSGGITTTAKSDLLSYSQETQNSAKMPVEVKQLRVRSKIRYRYGRTEVSSIVRNNDYRMSHEYNFTMRIPNDAFISFFSIKSNNETYHSFIAEKEIGSCLYQIQKIKRLSVGLLSLLQMEKDSKLFKVNVNIKANNEVEFSLYYDELISWETGYYKYHIYMNPLQMEKVQNFSVELNIKDLYSINSLNIFKNKDITEDVKKEINGSSASLVWEPSKNRSRYAKLISEDDLDQFLIYYDLQHSSKPGEILLRDGYFVHTLNTENLPVLPKHVIFVLDISGSMEGEPLRQLQAAMKNIFDDLRPEDFFNIITFSSDVHIWSPFGGRCKKVFIPYKSSVNYKNFAIDFIDKLQVHGSTNINDALVEALQLWKAFGIETNKRYECFYPKNYHQVNVTPMILFLTDGEPTSGVIDHQQILRNVKIENEQQIPIFSLAFGVEADFHFVKTLSLENRGFSRQVFVGIDSYLQLEKFYRQISSPVLTNVSFVYTSSIYTTSDISFQSFSTVNQGKEVQITGKISPLSPRYNVTQLRENESLFKISSLNNNSEVVNIPVHCTCKCQGETDAGEVVSENSTYVSNQCDDKDDFFMERRWAYIHLMNLLSKDSARSEEIRQKIIDWSLKYQFVTPYTSLVVLKPSVNLIVMDVAETDRFPGCKLSHGITDGESGLKSLKSPDFTPTHGPSSIRQLEGGRSEVNYYFLQASSNSQNREMNSTKKDYLLSNLTWLGNHRSISIIRENNISDYLIQKSYQRDESHYHPCVIRSNFLPGKCRPIQDCILAEFLTDFSVFLKSYFCPIKNAYGKFIGTCCPT